MDYEPQYRTDDGSAVRVWRDPVKNNFLSEREGRPIYDDALYVEIITPGQKNATASYEIERVYAPEAGMPTYRHPKYAELSEILEAFKRNDEGGASLAGTPLKEWPEISRSMAASLRDGGVFTVEALAALPDTRIGVVGPDGRTWRTKAQVWLESVKDAGRATALAAELERQKLDNGQLQEQVRQLAAQVATLTAKSGSPAPQTALPATQVAQAPSQASTGLGAPPSLGQALNSAQPSGDDLVPAGKSDTVASII